MFKGQCMFVLLMCLFVACGDDLPGRSDPPGGSVRTFIIGDQIDDWTTVVTDYPDGRFDDLKFVSEVRNQTLQSGERVNGVYQYAMNISDDLFKGVWRRVDGLTPGLRRFHIAAEIATPNPAGCSVGGGSSVYMKVGLLTDRPATKKVGPDIRAAFDKGQQSASGRTVPVVGDARNSIPGCVQSAWGRKALQTSEPIELEIGGDGVAYLLFGSESAFEAPDGLIYVEMTLRDVTSDAEQGSFHATAY